MIKKAVIPAAGYGTRFLPITKAIPKEMLPIIDRPSIEFIINEAIESGIEEILIIVSGNKKAIMDYFSSNYELENILLQKNKKADHELITTIAKGVKIHYTFQDEQLGLGHAVLQAKTFIGNEPFAVLLGDDIFVGDNIPATKQLINVFNKVKSPVLGTMNVKLEDTNKYGICIPKEIQDKSMIVELKGVVEKPKIEEAPSRSAIIGRYILLPTIFEYLENQEKGQGNEIQLTDAILRSLATNKLYSFDLQGKRYDVGSKIGYIEAIIDFGLKSKELSNDIKNLLKEKVNF